jgi:hypothetical protein
MLSSFYQNLGFTCAIQKWKVYQNTFLCGGLDDFLGNIVEDSIVESCVSVGLEDLGKIGEG